MVEFEAFLVEKKIDGIAFRAGDPAVYAEWEALFGQVSAESFVLMKKFYINPVRRTYPLLKAVVQENPPPPDVVTRVGDVG